MDQVLLTGAGGYLGACVLEGRLEAIPPGSLEVDAVIHCAGARRHRAAELDASNRQGTQRLLQGLKGSPRIVLVSSASVYGPGRGPTPIDEHAPVEDADAYGRSKLAAEGLVRDSGHPFVVFRATALFGQGGGWGNAFPTAALEAFLGGRPVVLHTPDRPADYLQVGAFGDLLLRALGPGDHWDQVFNAGGPPRSVHGLIHGLARVFEEIQGTRPEIKEAPGPPSGYPLLSTQKLDACFGALRQPSDESIFREMLTMGRPGRAPAR